MEKQTLTGAMVEIVHAIARDAGFSVRTQVMSFAALIPSLMARKIDLISAAMLRTPAREQVVDFSAPIFSYGGGVVVRDADMRDYATIADLKNKAIGTQMGTLYGEQAQQAGAADVKYYDSLPDALHDLHAGRIDAVYGDAPILSYHVAHIQNSRLRYVKAFHPPMLQDICLIVRKSDVQLLHRINAAIEQLRSTEIHSILVRWNLI
jgi:polar amino acid transport system substrate-binding protein